MNLQGKVFVISGGASGLGEATARLFVESGAKVVLGDKDAERGAALTKELGDVARFVDCNVVDEDQVQSLIDTALNDFGTLNGAISCAGIGASTRVAGKDGPFPLDMFKFVIDVNLIGTFNVIRLAATAMAKLDPDEGGERGVLVNTASVAAFDGQIGQAAYSASKGGIVGMTLPIARELAQFGIRCVTIAPGLFNTPLLARLPEEAKQSLGAQVPFPSRLGEPSEFASLAKQIVENPMLNGDTIRLDGAIRMAPR